MDCVGGANVKESKVRNTIYYWRQQELLAVSHSATTRLLELLLRNTCPPDGLAAGLSVQLAAGLAAELAVGLTSELSAELAAELTLFLQLWSHDSGLPLVSWGGGRGSTGCK